MPYPDVQTSAKGSFIQPDISGVCAIKYFTVVTFGEMTFCQLGASSATNAKMASFT
jgi:hypothetical protein